MKTNVLNSEVKVPTSKICSKCKEEKSLGKFHLNRSKKDGRSTYCSSCAKLYDKETKEKRALTTRKSQLRRNYGLSLEDYNRILLNQDNKCFICGRTPKQIKKKKMLAVDHDHETGEIRGLLCFNCNRNLVPFFEFEISRAERLLTYLTRKSSYGKIPEGVYNK